MPLNLCTVNDRWFEISGHDQTLPIDTWWAWSRIQREYTYGWHVEGQRGELQSLRNWIQVRPLRFNVVFVKKISHPSSKAGKRRMNYIRNALWKSVGSNVIQSSITSDISCACRFQEWYLRERVLPATIDNCWCLWDFVASIYHEEPCPDFVTKVTGVIATITDISDQRLLEESRLAHAQEKEAEARRRAEEAEERRKEADERRRGQGSLIPLT